MLTIEAVEAIAQELFPARSDSASLEYVSAAIGKGWSARPNDPDLLMLVVRLVTWETLPSGDRTIRDVKEQQVAFAPADEDIERFTAYLQAWHATLEKAFEHGTNELDTMMPHDFVHADALKLKTARTKEDFERAFLQRSRLGAWLPEAMRTPPATEKPESAAKRASSSSSSSSSSSDGSL